MERMRLQIFLQHTTVTNKEFKQERLRVLDMDVSEWWACVCSVGTSF